MSLESFDIHKSSSIWKCLGYREDAGNLDHGWISFKNEYEQGVSLMSPGACPHLFFNPSFTFFNGGKNHEVIEKVKGLGIAITENITIFNENGDVDNIIIRDPGGFGFFVFND